MRLPAALGLVCALALLPVVHAAPPPPPLLVQTEINYLLGFVESSGCEFYRNGSWHDSKAAQHHLRYKYDWLVRHGQITTTEDFIEMAATSSSSSGKPYKIRCDGSPVVSANAWLRSVLARYRLSEAH
ncbi:MAG: DUF5329 domain-containing protein [Steroidobacteraceae bacterium]